MAGQIRLERGSGKALGVAGSSACFGAPLAWLGFPLAQRVARLASQAARMNKQTFRAFQAPNKLLARTDIVKVATDSIANPVTTAYAYADSAEHREGIAAFLAKRKPQF